jgi:hypothetical protein
MLVKRDIFNVGVKMNTLVERMPDKLHCERWSFWFVDSFSGPILYLDSYQMLSRPSARHRFKIDKQYQRLGRPGRDFQNPIPLSGVPLDDEIKAEAIRGFTSSLVVKVWGSS